MTATYEGDNDFGTAAFLNIPSDWTIDDLNERLAAGAAAAPEQFSDGTTVNHTVPSMDWLYQLTTAEVFHPLPEGPHRELSISFPAIGRFGQMASRPLRSLSRSPAKCLLRCPNPRVR